MNIHIPISTCYNKKVGGFQDVDSLDVPDKYVLTVNRSDK